MHSKLSVAPMLDWTDRHCRYLHRLISSDALLYTEMVTTSAIKHSDPKKHLEFHSFEQPVVLQVGGSNESDLIFSCEMAQKYGYHQINLNVGCPSDRVQKGRFGACLMKEPQLVQTCLQAMISAVDIPVTVKCRIGVDDHDSFEFFQNFIESVAQAGIKTVIVHARKALLKGLSPKQNRTIPALNYDFVYHIKKLYPELTIIINGGINTVEQAEDHLKQVDGVMLGRAIWNNPWLLYDLQNRFFIESLSQNREGVLDKYISYCADQIQEGAKLHWLLPPVLNLYHGVPGNKKWKNHLVNQAQKRDNDLSIFKEAQHFFL